MDRRRLLVTGAAAIPSLAALGAPRVARSRDLAHLAVSVFPGGFNWPLFAGIAKGFFAANGLEIGIVPTRGSVAQMTDFAAGRFDIAMTAIDNVVAYVEGEGEAPIGAQPEFCAYMGSDSGFLSLVAAPGIASIEQLRGKTLSVDARTTGYAFVLFEMLARHGLTPGDYTIVTAGGMRQRWAALQQGTHAATLLSTPYDILAKASGFRQLGWATDVIGPYQGNVAAARRSWARAHEAELAGFIAAYAMAIDWLYEPAHRAEAVTILRRNLPDMSDELAQASYGELLDPARGFFRGARIDRAGLRTVLALRSRYAPAHRPLSDAGRYDDQTEWAASRHVRRI